MPQLPTDMSTRMHSTILATRLAWLIIEKKLNSMYHSWRWKMVCLVGSCALPDTARMQRKKENAKEPLPSGGPEGNGCTRL